jgi:hypothetical protein
MGWVVTEFRFLACFCCGKKFMHVWLEKILDRRNFNASKNKCPLILNVTQAMTAFPFFSSRIAYLERSVFQKRLGQRGSKQIFAHVNIRGSC